MSTRETPRAPGVGVCDTAVAGAGAPHPAVRGRTPAPRHPPRQGPCPWTPKPTAASADTPSLHAMHAGAGVVFPAPRPLPGSPPKHNLWPLRWRCCRAAASLVLQLPDLGGWHALPAASLRKSAGFGGVQRGRGPLGGGSKGASAPLGRGAGRQRPRREWGRSPSLPPWAGARGGSARPGSGEAPHNPRLGPGCGAAAPAKKVGALPQFAPLGRGAGRQRPHRLH
jgi:hypothetical protein